jgi:hypothetical protein
LFPPYLDTLLLLRRDFPGKALCCLLLLNYTAIKDDLSPACREQGAEMKKGPGIPRNPNDVLKFCKNIKPSEQDHQLPQRTEERAFTSGQGVLFLRRLAAKGTALFRTSESQFHRLT